MGIAADTSIIISEKPVTVQVLTSAESFQQDVRDDIYLKPSTVNKKQNIAQAENKLNY